MRPQQNRRIRGRSNNNNNNNNRRAPNPLTRNYESNGPDVKIRGNAQHIAEKYTTLARDAQATGDRVIAENYLQHAEHYMRIILSAQGQNSQQHVIRDDSVDADADESDCADIADNSVSEPAGSGPQPVIEGTPSEVVHNSDLGDNFNMADNDGAEAEQQQKRGRRILRQRMPRKAQADDSTAVAQPETGDSPAAVDQTIEPPRPRRGRRPAKAVEDAAE